MSDGKAADGVSYDKPVPRDPKSPRRRAQVRAQNRRREYLQRHPSYFESHDHELADPVLYERLVKRFQSASERTAEGKAKGYGRTLEASLLRSENTLASLASANKTPSSLYSGRSTSTANAGPEDPWDGPATDKQHGLELWRTFLEDRFVRGRDEDFNYGKVDGDEELDVWERGDAEDRWFDDEEPSWVDEEGHAKMRDAEDSRKGETGVLDY